MKRTMIVIVAAWAAICLGGTAWGQAASQPTTAESEKASPATLLEKGVYTEETVGDLDKAIEIYQQVIADAEANRKFAAQAQYRLAMCYLKKKQKILAIRTFGELIETYPKEQEIIAKAREQIAGIKADMPEAEVAEIVGDVVMDISTMAADDSRIPGLLKSLKELNEPAVLKAMKEYLVSDKNTVRRAAIFIIWRGEFSDASPLVPDLIKLCSHEEDLTRGMTALALGALKAAAAYDNLVEMTLSDKSPFTRRCAAYALGMLGDMRAKPVLEKALKDEDKMVRDNAEAGLTLLEKANVVPHLPKDVMSYIIDEHLKAAEKAGELKIRVNTHIYIINDKMQYHNGGLLQYSNDSDQPQAGPIHLGNFGRKKPDYVLLDETGQPQQFEFRERPGAEIGQWALWWTPQQPVEPGARRLLSYISKEPLSMRDPSGLTTLTMQNLFGSPVLENFFLVMPFRLRMVSPSVEPTSKKSIGAFDVYLWQKGVQAETNHFVNVVPKQPDATDMKEAEDLAAKGWKLWKARMFADAEVIFQRAAEKDPTNAEAWNGLGWSQFNQGKPINAREAFERALLIDPAHPAVLNGLGWVAHGQGETEQAIGYWKRAIAAQPGATAALNGLSIVYMETGQYPQAVEIYRQWLKFEPDSADAKAGIEKAEAADKALLEGAQGWLELMDKGEYVKAWESAGPLLRTVIDKEQWAKVVDAVRGESMGKLKSRKLDKRQFMVSIPGLPGGPFIALRYDSTFEKKHIFENIVLQRDRLGTWGVVGYTISPFMVEGMYTYTATCTTWKLEDVPKEASTAADAWLKLMDDGEYDKTYDRTTELFRSAVTKEEWARQAKNARSPLGKMKTRKLAQAMGVSDGDKKTDDVSIILQYETVFEKRDKAIETVTLKKGADGTWRVEGYFISPFAVLSHRGRLIGGGRNIAFTAPADGIIYLYDRGKLVQTKSLKKGENVEWLGVVKITNQDGLVLSDARLYFEENKANDEKASTKSRDPTSDILDKGKLVGGGNNIEFTAPADGIVYLYNRGELVQTKSLKKDQKVEWLGRVQITNHDGLVLSDARLYFKAYETPK